jgi:hypothetical protein
MDKNNNGFCFSPQTGRRLILAAAALAVLAPAAPASAAAGPERSLAGIAIFAPGAAVTRKFGNPSQILVGGIAPLSSVTGAAGGPGGAGPGGPPGGTADAAPGGFPGSTNLGAGLLPGFPGISSGGGSAGASLDSPPGGAPGGFPGAPGGFPGGPPSDVPGAASGFPGGAAVAAPVKPPVTLVYNRANGGSLEFTISPDKRVVQVRETGYNGAYGTARGVKLGMPYSAVVAKYGYPEDTMISGSIINISYKDTLHCGFQFLDQKLVGIIIATPD